jgi:hypothetical protein
MQSSKPNLTMDEFEIEEQLQTKMPAAVREELARDLGYETAREMMEQTEIVPLPSGAYMHLTTDSDGYWVAWNDRPFYDIQRFSTRRGALSALRESIAPILAQS